LDIKLFKKAYKFICNNCGKFLHTETEYCEKCGEKAVRKATKEDYSKYKEIAIKKAEETKKRIEEAKRAEKAKKTAEKA